jgi:hypothetical protein
MLRRHLLALALATAVALASAAPAGASVTHAGGITYVEKSHTDQPHGDKRFHANCPDGTHVLGGGAYHQSSFGGGGIQHSYPIDGNDADRKPDDGWEVGAFLGLDHEDWTVYATCAKRHVTYVTKSYKADPNSLTQRTVPCPGSQHIVGGGEKSSFKIGQNSAYPISGRWVIYEDSFESKKIPFKGYAICAGFNTTIEEGNQSVPSGQYGGLGQGCPVDRFVAAGGTANSGGHAQASVKFSYPDTPGLWSSATSNFSGGPMNVAVDAVCVKHL